MLVKLIGSAMILCSALVFAVGHYRFEERRLRTADGFIALLLYIKGQIDCYALPLCDILQGVPLKIYADCNSACGAESVTEMIDNSRIYLDEESERLLEAFASEFGSTFRAEQLRRCDHYVAALRERRGVIFAESQKRRRAGSAIWICSSLGLLILLW